jgi:hypothetical protein
MLDLTPPTNRSPQGSIQSLPLQIPGPARRTSPLRSSTTAT